MVMETLSPQDLVRRAVIEVASLPEQDIVVVMELIADLKTQARLKAERRAQAAELVARARQRAVELKGLPREAVFAEFRTALDRIREAAIADGTAIEGEWEGD